MDSQQNKYVAVDVAKKTLEVLTDKGRVEVENTKSGINKMMGRLKHIAEPHVVCEASGGYEQLLVETMQNKGIDVSVVSASRVRYFAKSEGVKAKTDPLDAQVIMRFAQQRQPAPKVPLPEDQKRIGALMDRRAQLIEHRAREKNRLQKSPEIVRESIEKIIQVLSEEIEDLESEIQGLVAENEQMTRAHAILTTIKGVGPVTVWGIIAYLPEIGNISRNELVAMAGVAPYNRDSGKMKHKRSIFGGRGKIRSILYLGVSSAAVYNPVIKTYVDGLIKRGKPHNCAMVAAIRKLLIHIQSTVKNHEISFA